MPTELVPVVRSVMQGWKGGAVYEGEAVNPWKLCSHFHRSREGAMSCAEKEVRRRLKPPPGVGITIQCAAPADPKGQS